MVVNEYGSEFYLNCELDIDNVSTALNDTSQKVYLRSGRDAIRYVAENISNNTKKVLLPAFCCESMIKPFSDRGIIVKFYKISKSFMADINDVHSIIEDGDALLYIDFFGKISFQIRDLKIIKEKYENIKIIEDRTQNIFNDKLYTDLSPDYVVASLRKWLALPDGGIAYSFNKEFKTLPINESSFFNEIRQQALKIKYNYLMSGNQTLKNIYRINFSDAEKYLGINEEVLSMSDYSRKLYDNFNFILMKENRKQNFKYLLDKLKYIEGIDTTLAYEQDCPLYFPILIEKRDDIQHMLASENIYCPVIWPIPEEAESICENSNFVAEHILAIPCDQRYSLSDMEYISNMVVTIISKNNSRGNII